MTWDLHLDSVLINLGNLKAKLLHLWVIYNPIETRCSGADQAVTTNQLRLFCSWPPLIYRGHWILLFSAGTTQIHGPKLGGQESFG